MSGNKYVPPRYATTPRPARCRQCRRPVLVALYDALPKSWDTETLNLLGELEAHLLGVKTWWLVGDNIYRRHSADIEASPRGFGGLIYREHSCANPPSTHLAERPHTRYDSPNF